MKPLRPLRWIAAMIATFVLLMSGFALGVQPTLMELLWVGFCAVVLCTIAWSEPYK